MASENSAEPSFSFAGFTPLTPPEGLWEPPPIPCIFPQLPSHYSLPEKKQDIRGMSGNLYVWVQQELNSKFAGEQIAGVQFIIYVAKVKL